jgi:bifunctional UDP-N-acetylglucosamine pyrophosphorylase/glucosamine-1-phosphate N-acetyltransferase
MNNVKSLDIVILAAGKGTRMKSPGLPKPLHKLNGIPIIQYLINNIPLSNFDNKFIVVPTNHSEIKKSLLNLEFNFEYIKQEEPKGTGDALLCTLNKLKSDNVIVVNSDTPLIKHDTFLNLIDVHNKNNSIISILIDDFNDQIPGNYGVVEKSGEGKIISINEKSSLHNKKNKQFNVGLYCFNLNWLKKNINNLRICDGEMYITELVDIAANQGIDINYLHPESNDESLGINNKYELSVARKIATKRKNIDLMNNGVNIIDPDNTYIDFNCQVKSETIIYPGTIIKSNSIIDENSVIGPNTEIINCIIKKDTIIKQSVIKDSVIGSEVSIGPFSHIRNKSTIKNNVDIGTNVEVKNSTINSHSKLSHFCYIGDTVIGANVNIGAGTVTCNYDGIKKHSTIIKNNVFIGSGSMLIAPLVIHENVTIGAGSVVTKDIEKNQLAYGVPAINRNKTQL